MSHSLLALVTRSSDAEEDRWLAHLRAAMPGEEIRSLRGLSEDERARVDVAIVANPDPADLELLPNLKWVHSLWAGVERLVAELQGFTAPVVRLTDPELARNMAEAVLAWTYYLQRDMPAYAKAQREKTWAPRPYVKPSQLRVGLLGLGKLGGRAAERLLDAGFQVSGWSRSLKSLAGVTCHAGEAGLSEMLGEADILVSLLPLTAQTRGLLNAARFAQMKPGAQIINFGRGPVIDDEALLAALRSGQIGHAVLDVFAVEPLPPEHPYWSTPGVTVLPHISAETDRVTASALVAGNIAAWRAGGQLPETVDFAAGY
ncbi:2-hydroxyacid dehydrogenase [Falsigemmobacter faecalis]|uniref:Glyoxylate/hydroxypyruvate reductase A n=1 Tax=Falsigemmobacter faecalis TaxID=2488730 RepID=A0A3P3DJ67_9RHOB|nr:glyoxylate/hydroxypyruvate reductase A [Falsigemmobacter faecalis]RRH74310.1 glyoxylate/hydroxypyruvate reductase A [Falsigemmobacter faecalis]